MWNDVCCVRVYANGVAGGGATRALRVNTLYRVLIAGRTKKNRTQPGSADQWWSFPRPPRSIHRGSPTGTVLATLSRRRKSIIIAHTGVLVEKFSRHHLCTLLPPPLMNNNVHEYPFV